jgi:hypothetical protein
VWKGLVHSIDAQIEMVGGVASMRAGGGVGTTVELAHDMSHMFRMESLK